MARTSLISSNKFQRLSRRLDETYPGYGELIARGALEKFWQAARYNKPYLAGGDIELVINWQGSPGSLFDAFFNAGMAVESITNPGTFFILRRYQLTFKDRTNKSVRIEVLIRDGNRCRYCGEDGAGTVDHIIPRCQGGTDSVDNLAVSCQSCNSRKGGRTPDQAGMVLRRALESTQ